ncbi:putative xanthine dehydrogenase subunit A [bioreactor metagenome]|uniref:Putative xanthine dehydrogenase subunit A n=1 Tax=bioreactor metagenome TaxID=1076179 RepID=A0A645B6N7_9ZZZZ
MKDLLEAILSHLRSGKRAMLATVAERRGSAPRGVGTAMAVFENGEQAGTVGGGAMEYRVRQDAVELLRENTSAMKAYEIHADETNGSSGGVTILFRPFSGEEGRLRAENMLDAFQCEEGRYLVCRMMREDALETSLMDASAVCALMGQDDPPRQALFLHKEQGYLIEPLLPASRVILFGGGHVAQVMARQLDLLDCRVWVVEDRAEFAVRALFPLAERVVHCAYEDAQGELQITKRDHVIVMSRGHETDYQILRWVLRSAADYVGCIGSKRKIALTRERLLADGVTRERLDRLHAPIGLEIGAETPAEIAVSVAAEWIRYRSEK